MSICRGTAFYNFFWVQIKSYRRRAPKTTLICGEKSKVIYALSLVDKFSDFGARHSTICGYKSKVIDAVPQKPLKFISMLISMRIPKPNN
ncbi:hypothetical protein [Microseira wollei]|uniref:Transposase n=1 Tax=Microseira wollei NIES-4236 TaxID=2530354 RepID=A0AAV3X6M8_9CYAN|nr:hypothetical protein [Microseira wollei]GET37003.1 hypothetical protein MiSe_17560 [Microseira wollei NIES-4236]